ATSGRIEQHGVRARLLGDVSRRLLDHRAEHLRTLDRTLERLDPDVEENALLAGRIVALDDAAGHRAFLRRDEPVAGVVAIDRCELPAEHQAVEFFRALDIRRVQLEPNNWVSHLRALPP